MKITYKQFIVNNNIPVSPIYLVFGNPYHLLNEVQSRLERMLRHDETLVKRVVVDSDFDISIISDDFNSLSLFNEKKILILAVVSNSIPKRLTDFLQTVVLPDDLKIILKLGPQTSAFKKTNLFKIIDNTGHIIEVTELKGLDLKNWVKAKFKKNKINFSENQFQKLMEKNEGNTSAISQELYKMSLLEVQDLDDYFNLLQKEYKYNEYDLVNCLLEKNLAKSIKILKYLHTIKIPEVYILFLINLELKKIYSLHNEVSPMPYIPSFRKNLYYQIYDSLDKPLLKRLMEYCHEIDLSIKTSYSHTDVWHKLELLISSFILNKSPYSFINDRNINGYK